MVNAQKVTQTEDWTRRECVAKCSRFQALRWWGKTRKKKAPEKLSILASNMLIVYTTRSHKHIYPGVKEMCILLVKSNAVVYNQRCVVIG